MRVRVYATLRPIVGGREVELDLAPGSTVRELVEGMIARWPELEPLLLEGGALSRRAHVFVEGRSARHLPDGEKTVLAEGQTVDIAPAVAGG
jgi:molybdopterin synthase sulfur carrier subunit